MAACLQELPQDLLQRIVASACDTPESLLAVGGLCRALRAATGCPAQQLRPLWTRTIIALVDPAAALAHACEDDGDGEDIYFSLAQALARSGANGWFALLHALARRECVACGDVTRWVAWRSPAEEDALLGPPCRCCVTCELDADAAGGAAADSNSGAASESESESSFLLAPLLARCAVINAQLFEPQPSVVLVADELNNPGLALIAALEDGSDGDTIGLRGAFSATHLGIACNAAVRLLGLPGYAPWRNVHAATEGMPADSAELAALGVAEQAAAAAIGFPSASIHTSDNCFEVYKPVWLENLYISSGAGSGDFGVDGGVFAGLTSFVLHDDADTGAPSFVLRRCWITGYQGTGMVLGEGAAAALLQCCVTNCCFAPIYCESHTTLRLRSCHLLWNTLGLGVGDVSPEMEQRVAAANVFVRHPDGAATFVENAYHTSEDVRLLD
jgi:hypothetical protein